jgi:hypothetical protein
MTTLTEGFGEWIPLTHDGVQRAPDAPAAVQIGRADKSLVQYPKGKSSMLFYFYAARSARDALRKMFADELDAPGAKGQGAMSFRFVVGGDEARLHLERLYEEFEVRFGAPPFLNQDDEP